jgi:hypothetical protein
MSANKVNRMVRCIVGVEVRSRECVVECECKKRKVLLTARDGWRSIMTV